MSLRLSLAARIAAIVLAALLAVWIVAVALRYWASEGGAPFARPDAAQIAAIVELVEATPADRRDVALRAVGSHVLRARLDPAAAPLDAPRADPAVVASYAAALEGRPLDVIAVPESANRRPFPRLFARAVDAMEMRIGLRDGETLLLDIRNSVAVSRFGLPIGFGAGLFGTLIALVALIVLHRETRPLARLAAAVDRMDLRDAPTPLPPARTSAPEIQALIAAFNRLGERLATLMRGRMALLGGISHDVRTFATRLRLRIDRIPDAAERERAVSDIADMIRLLDDALLASRAGAGEMSQELVEFDEIVRSEVADRQAADAPVDLATDGLSAPVLGDRLALRRIVSNLVDNALAYGRVAHVALRVTATAVEMTVDDEGEGVPIEHRAALLEPFVRLETSRNRRTGGAGLGLAVVRSLADAHDAVVSIGAAPGGGARFSVRVPLFRT